MQAAVEDHDLPNRSLSADRSSYVIPAPDWDIPVSIIMATSTFLTAGWSMHVMVERRWCDWPLMAVLTWWSVDGCYALYWSLISPLALSMMRDANWPASLSLYWVCGLIWFWNGTLRELMSMVTSRHF